MIDLYTKRNLPICVPAFVITHGPTHEAVAYASTPETAKGILDELRKQHGQIFFCTPNPEKPS